MGRKDIVNLISPLAGPLINDAIDRVTNNTNDAASLASAEKERDDYKKQLADMQSAQNPQVNNQPTQFRVPGMKKGGKVSSASKRADGCCVKGKTKGRMV
jgi:hypothetical protein